MAASSERVRREPAARTQVVERVAHLLTAVAQQGSQGARLVDLARTTGIARPSAHRLLHELIAVGYVRQVPSRRYALGSALFSLGLSAPHPIRSLRGIESVARDLSDSTGDTVYVSMRQVDGVHYLVRTSGRFPIRAYAADVGETVPFLNTYSGIVLLAGLGPAAEAQALRRWEADQSPQWGPVDPQRHLAQLTGALHQARTAGYVYGTDFFVPTIAGVAVPVPARSGAPLLAVSVSAVNSRLPPERASAVRLELEAAATRIAEFVE